MSGHLRTLRIRHHGPPGAELPDAGDVLQTSKQGLLYLIHEARPTRGHPPDSGRLTVLVERLDRQSEVPAGATVFVLRWSQTRRLHDRSRG